VRVNRLVLIVGLAALLGGGLFAQEVQTPSATLEDVITIVQENPYVPDELAQVLSAFIASAVEQGALTPEQVLELLATVGWDQLTDEDAVGFVVRALELALIAVTAEDAAYDEVLSTLVEMAESGELGPLASEVQSEAALIGLATALLKSTQELTPELLEEIEELVSEGVPPGQVVHTVRSLVREGASEEEIVEALDELAEHGPPGHPGDEDEDEGHGPPPGHGKPADGDDEDHGDDKDLGCTDCDQNGHEDHGPSSSLGKPGDDDEDEGRGPPPGRGKPGDEDDDEDEDEEGRGRRGG